MSVRCRLVNESAGDMATVAARWKKQYLQPDGTWLETVSGDSSLVHAKLAALTDTATPADVAAIIGNESWIGAICNECDAYSSPAIQIGAEPDYESATVTLCWKCGRDLFTRLMELLHEAPKP